MLPRFLCLFSTSFPPTSVKTTPESSSQGASVWWNPIGSGDTLLNGFRIHEGDILMWNNETSKNAIKSKSYLWENGLIPYEFGDDFTQSEKTLISDAMTVLEEKTCVKFVKKKDEKTFIRFQKEKNGCYAPVGRLPGNYGPLPVNLQAPECFKEIGIVEHELLHVVGLFHEQSRPDRDEHVIIHWCNIEPNKEKEFLKGTDNEMNTFGLRYDFGSIMHYPRWAFSRNGQPTITAKLNPHMELGQRKGPSNVDIEKVIKMYECKN